MKNNESGFTILELMITVLMVAILAAASIPSFLGLIQSRQVSSTTTELISYLSLARQEAIGRNQSVALKGLDADASSVQWGEGFKVIYDNDLATIAIDEETILQGKPSSRNVSIEASIGQAGFKFNASGTSNLREVIFTVCPGSNGTNGKEVKVLMSGQITQKDKPCVNSVS